MVNGGEVVKGGAVLGGLTVVCMLIRGLYSEQ